MNRYAEVAVPLPLRGTFTYEIPHSLKDIQAGSIVLVPFGKRRITGYVIDVTDSSTVTNPKKLTSLLYDERVFSDDSIKFLRHIAERYLAPLGEVIKMALPPGFDAKSELFVRSSGLEVMKLSGKCRSLLDALKYGPMPLKKAMSKFKVSMNELKDLQRARFLDLFQDIKAPQKPRTISRLEIVKGREITSYRTRSTIEKKLLDLLKSESKPIDMTVIRRELNVTKGHVKKLLDANMIRLETVEQERVPYLERTVGRDKEPELTIQQKTAWDKVVGDINEGKHRTHMLYGITGSGKTEVYMRLISSVLEKGKTALALVPEISLTPQLIHRFRSRFGDIISVIHSSMSRGERFDQWRKILRKEAKIVIGARSALFAPLDNIGLIVVDEEHDPSYKQEDKIMYNARDLAIDRGRMVQAPVVLGSATPSIESYYKAKSGQYELSILDKRPTDYGLPRVDIIDLRKEKGKFGKKGFISQELLDAIKDNSSGGGKTILFLNRRGFSSSVLCYMCGTTIKCPNCAVAMKYHDSRGKLICHYCEHEIDLYGFCEVCGAKSLLKCGFGTEHLEREIKSHFPDLAVVRMDRDTTTKKFSHERIIRKLESGEIDVLIGTQMVSKGLDAKGVTLVGVVLADISLNIPDFRSCERTFSLLTQVAGRSGRGKREGRVLIQTFNPEHYSIYEARKQDYESFYEKEVCFRRDVLYPPFVELANVHFSSTSQDSIERHMGKIKEISKQIASSLKSRSANIEILGPCPSPIEKLKSRYRWQMLLKSPDSDTLQKYSLELSNKLTDFTKNKDISFKIDIDPQNFM